MHYNITIYTKDLETIIADEQVGLPENINKVARDLNVDLKDMEKILAATIGYTGDLDNCFIDIVELPEDFFHVKKLAEIRDNLKISQL